MILSLNKKMMLSVILIVIFLLLTFMFLKLYGLSQDGINITIENQTNSNVTGLMITYKNILNDIELPSISPSSSIKTNINPKEQFVENSMKIYYFDKFGIKHEEILIGYFEKGYDENIKIKIISVNEEGVYNLIIK